MDEKIVIMNNEKNVQERQLSTLEKLMSQDSAVGFVQFGDSQVCEKQMQDYLARKEQNAESI